MASTIWKGRLNFGLVSIPIKLYRAARAEKIHMHKVQRQTGTRVRQVFVPSEEWTEPEEASVVAPAAAAREREETTQSAPLPKGPTATPQVHPPVSPEPAQPARELSRQDIVHGYEYEKDRYVNFEPEELEQLAPKNSPDMQIVEFVRFAEVDPVYLETSYYVAPDRGGEKPYALLFETLKKTGYAAIGEFVMHRRDQILILRPATHGLLAHTLFYQDEVRSQDEYQVEKGQVVGKEMDLAIKLVEALAGSFEPEKFKDQYRDRLQQAIAQKVESGAVTQPPVTPSKGAPVVDIMAALQESLAKARKPVASESAAPVEKKQRRSPGRKSA